MLPSNILASLLFAIIAANSLAWVTKRKHFGAFGIVSVIPDYHWTLQLYRRWLLKTTGKPVDIQAYTLGSFVFVAVQHAYDLTLIRHEFVHIKQQQKWSILQPILYAWYSWRLQKSGKNSYWDNPFEVEARTLAKEPSNAS